MAATQSGQPLREVCLADTVGMGSPPVVEYLVKGVQDMGIEPSLHLHNTRGATIASYYEALNLGATEFDTSLGGMGGCPYCGNGRAAGHVPTEDFVHMCHEMGIETGYNLDKVIEAACIAEEIVGHALKGHVSKAGPNPHGECAYPANMPFVETLDEASHFRNGPQVYDGQLSPWRDGDALTRASRA